MAAWRAVAVCSVGWALACGRGGSPPAPFDAAFSAVGRVANATSLAISQGGSLAREQYFGGTGPDSAHDVRSVTKSVVALVIGAALDQGCLQSLDLTLGEALGSLAPTDPAKAAITLRDLLAMSSGFAGIELGADGYNQWASAPNQVAFTLGKALVASPGTTFNYDSGAFHLLSVALTRACGPTAAFARDHLLQPLGIASRDWETDNQGFTNGAAGLQLTTREMLSVGNLVLDAGRGGGAQLVSAAFVEAATRTQIATGANPAAVAPGYGFGWWIGTAAGGAPFVLAEGYGGQFILVVPRSRSVAAITARWQGVAADAAATQFRQLLDVIDRDVLPSL